MQQQLAWSSTSAEASPVHDGLQPSGEFQASIEGLLGLVRAETGANGYALYAFEEAKQELVFRCGHGIPIRKLRSNGAPNRCDAPEIVSIPLNSRAGLAGVLAFSFIGARAVTPAQRELLGRAADSIAALLSKEQSRSHLIQVTARIAGLEARLADLKIVERALGLAEQTESQGRTEVLLAHVTSVLSSLEFEEQLTAHVRDLEERLAERRTVSEAKAALQRALHLTEEEAYLRLRHASRRTRRRLVVVAREVLDGGQNSLGA